jgi:hypothetical protein
MLAPFGSPCRGYRRLLAVRAVFDQRHHPLLAVLRISPALLVRRDVGVGHLAEGRYDARGVRGRLRLDALLLRHRVDLVGDDLLAQRRVSGARLVERDLGKWPEAHFALAAVDAVAVPSATLSAQALDIARAG